jgi:predicted CoA-substrate-specific enzyme activase
MLSCGIDVGSVQTKAVIIDGNFIVQGRGRVHSGANLARAARHALQEALREAEIAEFDVTYFMGTGYGRFLIPFGDKIATEPVCHARGAIYRFPCTRTVLDIGGQDTTAIKVDSRGNVIDFVMNDKCAAGTGRFLEAVADLLNVSQDQMNEMGLKGSGTLQLTSMCSVLAEADIINHLEQGRPLEDIVACVFDGLANRAVGLLSRVGIEDEVTLTGGVSGNRAMVKAIEARLGRQLNTGVDGVYVGALGAAILGLEQVASCA